MTVPATTVPATSVPATSAAAPAAPRRPTVRELRLVAFKSHVGTQLPLAPVTVLHGASGAGASNVLDGLAALSGLAGGGELTEALSGVRGGLAGCVPHGGRGFRLGCTVGTPQGAVRLEVAVRTDGRPRVVAEQLALDGQVLLATGAEDQARGRINASWHSDGRQGDIRAPLSASALLTAQLPLRVAGATPGEQRVLVAVQHLLTALREVFLIDPAPGQMRDWVSPADDARLRSSADNLSAVLARIEGECRIRYGRLLQAVRAAAPFPAAGLGVLRAAGDGRVLAAVDEGTGRRTSAALLGAGTLRHLAFATVLLTGPGVLQMGSATEVPDAERLLTVLAEDFDQRLLPLAVEVAARGHVRLLATGREPADVPGVVDVHCRREPTTGGSVLEGGTGSGQ